MDIKILEELSVLNETLSSFFRNEFHGQWKILEYWDYL